MNNNPNRPVQGTQPVQNVPVQNAPPQYAPPQYAAPQYGMPVQNTPVQAGQPVQYAPAPMYTPPAPSKRKAMLTEAIATIKPVVVFILAVIFGVVFSRVVLRGGFALGVTITVALFYAFFTPIILKKGKKIRVASLVLAVPTLLLSVAFGLESSISGNFLMVCTLFALVVLQSTLLANCSNSPALSWGAVGDSIAAWCGYPWLAFGPAFASLFKSRGEKKKGLGAGGKVVIGLVIALPVVAILLVIFSCSDAVFNNLVSTIIDKLDIDLGGVIFDLIFGFIIALWVMPLVLSLRSGYCYEGERVKMKRWCDSTIAATVLFAAGAVYLLFVGVQSNYLFGYFTGKMMTLPDDMTWAEYARSGFFELSAIIVLSFIVIAFFASVSKTKENGSLPIALKIALTLLAACNLVLVASAVLRMLLYIDYCHLTRIRIAVLILIAVMTVCLIAVIIKLWIKKFPLLAVVLAVFIVGACGYGSCNFDRIIADYNVYCYLDKGETIDIDYLGKLTYSAAPAVERLILESEDKEVVRAAQGILYKYYAYGDGDYRMVANPLTDITLGQWTLDADNACKIYNRHAYHVSEDDYYFFEDYAYWQVKKRNYEADSGIGSYRHQTFSEYYDRWSYNDYEYNNFD